MESIIFLLIGVITGIGIGYLLAKLFFNKNSITPQHFNELKQELEQERKENELLLSEKSSLASKVEFYECERDSINEQLIKERDSGKSLSDELSTLKADHRNLMEKLDNQKNEIEELQQRFRLEFKNLANELLEEKSKKFTDQNKLNLEHILNPLKERIKTFEEKVDKTYKHESEQRISLKEEIKHLTKLNQDLSEEASNLTRALKSDSKQQGNWGEVILERILERSGLIEGEEYKLEVHSTTEDNKRVRPDVVVYLPDEKHLIIDSKVSLSAYEKYVNCEEDNEAKRYLKSHIDSVRSHIKKLGDKDYFSAKAFSSPEMVMMFIPIEASFSAAVKADVELFNYAWDRRIVLVSPSTLLASLMTISSVWKQERQNKNALEIARQSGALYDKFVGFLDDLDKIGEHIRRTKNSYDDAYNKLKIGRGNLIGRADKIRALGAQTKKEIPNDLVEEAMENNDAPAGIERAAEEATEVNGKNGSEVKGQNLFD